MRVVYRAGCAIVFFAMLAGITAADLKTFGVMYGRHTAVDKEAEQADLDWAAEAYDININNYAIADAADRLETDQWFLKYFPPPTMSPQSQELAEQHAAEHGHLVEDYYFHAAESFVYARSYGAGDVQVEIGERIPSFWSTDLRPWPAGNLGSDAWRDMVCHYFADNEHGRLKGCFLDSSGHMFSAVHHPDKWVETRAAGATDYASASRILDGQFDGMMDTFRSTMADLGYPDFAVVPNLGDAASIAMQKFNVPAYQWKFWETFDSTSWNGWYRGAGATRDETWDMLKNIHDSAVGGVSHLCHTQTGVNKERAIGHYGLTEDRWLGCVQHLLASYYLIEHDNTYFAIHFGGQGNYSPKPTYRESHWHPNMEVDFGRPISSGREDWWGETGTDRFYLIYEDPEESRDKVFARSFEKGIVVARYWKPGLANVGTERIEISLGRTYRRVLEDNTLGPPVDTISIGNGEGMLLMYADGDPPQPPVTPPLADLADPTNGSTVAMSKINGRQYIDVTFTDTGETGLNASSITDSDQEFRLASEASAGVTVKGAASLVSGTTYRYYVDGAFVGGSVLVKFDADSFEDNAGNGNLAESEEFTIKDDTPPPDPPEPEAKQYRIKSSGPIILRIDGDVELIVEEIKE